MSCKVSCPIDPGEPIEFDVSKASEFQLKENGISWVPRSLNEAIHALSEDSILAQTIGRTYGKNLLISNGQNGISTANMSVIGNKNYLL
ncbi:Glutamine synthetase, catalytic domain [Peribacillus simplex]|uniref:Glutamine synthetase, catalytic domain n=1 Tax=Peribacillus simplex TaxID=1478 RepID=A0A9X8RAJ3_9BACI|nr:Glutamine synthetase, catalytic domain [Peribacillus simplex]